MHANGTKKWGCAGAQVTTPPAVGPGGAAIFAGTEEGLLALTAAHGAELWRSAAGRGAVAAPVVSPDGDVVYTGSPAEHTVFAVHARSGAAKWNCTLPEGVGGGPLFLAPVLSPDGGTVYVSFGGG